MRTHIRKQLALKNQTIDDQTAKTDTYYDDTQSFTLSTEMCMIIHGAILATLFVVAISR